MGSGEMDEKGTGREKGEGMMEHKGLEITPAYHRSAKNEGKGIAVRPATYTNRSTKGSGVDNKASYDRKSGADLHV